RNGELLVDNRPSFDAYVIPEEIHDRDELIRSFHSLIGMDPNSLEEKLGKEAQKYGFRPVLIKKNLSREELAIVEAHLFNLPGVMIQIKPQRYYLHKELGSHLIGYLGEISEPQLTSGNYPDNKQGDLIGQVGLERVWQKNLNGIRGGEQVEVDAAGRRLTVISRRPPIAGQNLGLTIDKKLQMAAEKCLKDKKGAIVALHPMTGEILAMASNPAYDPNLFLEGLNRAEWARLVTSKEHPLQNRAVAGQYPPGSTFKMVMALAGLEEGLDPREEAFCDGKFPFGEHTFRCWRKQGHGRVALHRAIVESCDVYFYKLGKRLGVDKIHHYARMCGLGTVSGYELGSEKEGLIPSSEWKLKRFGVPWQPGETISISIGQSFVLVTPLQMARLISAFFNGGVLYQPKVVKWVGKDDKQVYQFTPEASGRLKVKEQNLALIRSALIGAVNEPGGTGSRSRIKTGALVAGKTGTAQVVAMGKEQPVRRGEEPPPELNDHAWFVAIASADKPEIAVAVLVENGGHGGSAAAPMAKEMFETFYGKGP
ncbi:MAG: penicillin-binding protein 2, partial [Deltaproteobacteria bacterium]|nr:penicillin-binding protein 2 [Deltaproteobacteria bacterium]